MTSLQKSTDIQHVAAISINPEAISAPNFVNGSSSGSRKHRVRSVVHDLAKLCIPSAMGMVGRDGHDRDDRGQIHTPEKYGGAGPSTGITQRQLITEPKPSPAQACCPQPLDSNTQKHELQQLQQQKHRARSRRPPLTELVSVAGAANAVYIVNTPRRRPVALKLSTDASSIEREYCVQSTARGVFRHLQRLLKQAGVNLILPTIPACVALYPNLSSFADGRLGRSSCSSATPSLPLPVFLSLDLPEHQVKKAAAFSMEYIYPFHENHTKYLIHRYLAGCAQADALTTRAHAGPSRLLGKLCMGAHVPMSDPSNPEMHDRPIYVDQLIAEGVDALALAASMGATLAAFHWSCGLDARGVQFMIGCDVKGRVRIWATSFAQCSTFCRTEKAVKTQLVRAVAKSAGNWPPWERGVGCVREGDGKDMWEHFRFVYLQVSGFLLDPVQKNVKEMPGLFFKELEASYEKRDMLRA